MFEDSVGTVLLCVVVPLLGYYLLSWMFPQPSKNFPPGPREWGTNWKLLKASLNGTLVELSSEWAKEYGELTFVHSIGQPTLFLNSADVVRRLLAADKYKFLLADRIQLAASKLTKFNGKDLVFSKFDAIMRKKRRLFYNLIGLYGDGVEKFENVVWGEMERMFSELDKSEGDDVDITKELVRTLKIIMYILAIGDRPSDPSIPDALEDYDLATNKLIKPDAEFVLNYLPFITLFPGKYQKLVNELKVAKKKADELIYYGPKRTYIPGQPRGMTDLLLDHQKKPGYEWLEKDEEHIMAFLGSMFLAAQITSRCLITGIFLCLLNYPKVTEKITAEIDRVIGDQRPKIEHKSSMPYTEATILEALRILSPAPLSGLRKASQDIDFEGMLIPKNTLVLIHFWHYLHDENIWEDPWVFKPERFLDSDGQLLQTDHQKRKDLLVFGAGARACPGDAFSISRAFLIITSILQRYDLLPPANEKLPPADFRTPDEQLRGIVRLVQHFSCRVAKKKKVQE